jgi:CO dehydrogenase maturation factor
MLKVITTGKGGVGKTTTISTLATMMARSGKKIIVLDTDPSMNLAMTLGLPYLDVPTITENKHDINEELDRMDEDPVQIGREIIENYSRVNKDGIRVIVMGAIPDEGNGCLCSAISIMKILLNYFDSDSCPDSYDVAFVDSQAGPEILGRGLAKDFDCNLVMTEPTPKSAEVSRQVVTLAKNLGIEYNILVVNKSENESDLERISNIVGIPIGDACRIEQDHSVVEADIRNATLLDEFPDCSAVRCIGTIKNRLELMEE